MRWQASAYSARERKKIRKHLDTRDAAKTWREDANSAIRQGTKRAPTPTTVDQAAEALIEGMRSGVILDRSGSVYKPSTVRTYESALRLRVLHAIGHLRLGSLDRHNDVQALVDRWRADGLTASTVQNTLNQLQVIARRTVRSGELPIDPTDGLELPSIGGRRDRIASPAEAAAPIAALPAADRALWATAFYARLRRGELRGRRWSDVDFDAGSRQGATAAPWCTDGPLSCRLCRPRSATAVWARGRQQGSSRSACTRRGAALRCVLAGRCGVEPYAD
ncbi:MAG: hypothetical protein ABI355_02615 [Solirubrobacteraceae bacterium]